MKSKFKFNPRFLAEGGMVLALASGLSMVKLFSAPYGGSVTTASMVPILLFSILRGPKGGLLVAVIYGMLQFILGPIFLTPLQFLLDFPLAFGSLGLAGVVLSPLIWEGLNRSQRIIRVIGAVCLGIGGRLLCHYLAGVVFWGQYAPEGMSPWIYSLIYNGSYLGIEFLISVLVIWLLIPRFSDLIKRSRAL
jgi:thiamine transporter